MEYPGVEEYSISLAMHAHIHIHANTQTSLLGQTADSMVII